MVGRIGRRRASPGFALPALLVVLAFGGLWSTRAQEPLTHRMAREREIELRFRGEAYAAAIRSFFLAETDPDLRRLPSSVEELVRDPRFPEQRHLRQPYADPMFPAAADRAFQFVRGSPDASIPDGAIGVVSTSDRSLIDRSVPLGAPQPATPLRIASDLEFLADLTVPEDEDDDPTGNAVEDLLHTLIE